MPLILFKQVVEQIRAELDIGYAVTIRKATQAEIRKHFAKTQLAAAKLNAASECQTVLLRKMPTSTNELVMALFAVAHEMRHVYQFYVLMHGIEHPDKGEWEHELLAEESTQDIAVHNELAIEIDANAYAVLFMRQEGIQMTVSDLPNAEAVAARMQKIVASSKK